jgi:hypothetical protein
MARSARFLIAKPIPPDSLILGQCAKPSLQFRVSVMAETALQDFRHATGRREEGIEVHRERALTPEPLHFRADNALRRGYDAECADGWSRRIL